MTQQNDIQWDDDSGEAGVYLDKSALAQMGPQVTRIVAFERMQSWDVENVLHVAFENPTGWTKLTKPMQGALKKLFPNMTPAQLVGKPVMVMANYTPAKGQFSEGHQIVISAPPSAPQVPAMPEASAVPQAPAAPPAQEEIAF